MSIENQIVNLFMSLALPFIILGCLGMMAGMKPQAAFKPLSMAATGILKLSIFATGQLVQWIAAFCGSSKSATRYTVGRGRQNDRW